MRRALAAAVAMAALAAAAADVTCTGSVTEGAVHLACSSAGGPNPPPPPPLPPPPPVSTPTGCSTTAYSLTYEYNGKPYRWSLASGQVASFRMPVLTAGGRHAEMLVFQTTNTPSGLLADVAIADCPGKFDVEPTCRQMSVDAWTVDLHAFAKPRPFGDYCELEVGRTYYFNVRHLTCSSNAVCELGTQYVGDMR